MWRAPAGGYRIIDEYKLSSHFISENEKQWIVTALRGLRSALGQEEESAAERKIRQIGAGRAGLVSGEIGDSLSVDFSAMLEFPDSRPILNTVREAVRTKKRLRFSYTDQSQNRTEREVEPLAISFQWYSWYLFAYCLKKKEYRTFRLSRIRNPELLKTAVSGWHENIRQIMENQEQANRESNVHIVIKCRNRIRVAVEEYFGNGKVLKEDDKTFLYQMSLPEGERHWLGLLLSFGTDLEVLAPDELRDRIEEQSFRIHELYRTD